MDNGHKRSGAAQKARRETRPNILHREICRPQDDAEPSLVLFCAPDLTRGPGTGRVIADPPLIDLSLTLCSDVIMRWDNTISFLKRDAPF
jgi:hypothetical protein